jgi:hypothetical protein
MHKFLFTLKHPLDHYSTNHNMIVKKKLYEFVDMYKLPVNIADRLFARHRYNILDWDPLLYLCCAYADDYQYFADFSSMNLIGRFIEVYNLDTNKYLGNLLGVPWQTCRRWMEIIEKSSENTVSVGVATILLRLYDEKTRIKVAHFIKKVSPYTSGMMKQLLI